MIKKKTSSFAKRYESSYKSKDKGGVSKVGVMDWKKIDGDVSFFKPAVGRNRINIIPYEIKTKNHPLVRRGEMEVGDMDYVMDVWVHRSVGPTEASVLCLKNTYGKPCPICERANALRKQGNEEEADALKASRRVFYNVLDMKEPDKPKVFETSHWLFEKELIDEARDDEEGGFVDFADPEDGKEIKFKASEDTLGNNKFLKFKSFSFEDRDEAIPYSIIENAISFDEIMNVPTYEEVEKLLYGNDDSSDDEDELAPKKSSDDEDEEDDDEEEEEVKPSKKPSKHRDEEDDEDEDEDDEPEPKKSPKKSDEDDAPKNKCKFGHRFGRDCDEFEDCENCDMWAKCLRSK